MTLLEIVRHIAKHEGLKSVVKVCDVREIVAIMSDLIVKDNGETVLTLVANGKRRKEKKKAGKL
jgi:hypothetical protein